jgi:ESF2/ABP1 family protein
MATRRKNEWLEADASEDEDAGYDSELAESRQKAIVSKSVKRRKIDHRGSESDSEQSEDGGEAFEDAKEVVTPEEQNEGADSPSKTLESPRSNNSDGQSTSKYVKPKSALAKRLERSTRKTANSGVVYVSRVPPFMKPHTLKHFLQPYALHGIGRIFLTPETPEAHKSRVRSGGNKKRNFSDGWVEFNSKREAQIAVQTLNTRLIGGKKGGYYHDDVWNLKYLKGFKWKNLTEDIANQNAERSARLRAEGQKERREVREYLGNVERAKMLEGMERKKRLKEEAGGAVDHAAERNAVGSGNAAHRPEKRQFRQTEAVSKSKHILGDGEQPEEVRRVLSKIF